MSELFIFKGSNRVWANMPEIGTLCIPIAYFDTFTVFVFKSNNEYRSFIGLHHEFILINLLINKIVFRLNNKLVLKSKEILNKTKINKTINDLKKQEIVISMLDLNKLNS
jgi:hypothetical protein